MNSNHCSEQRANQEDIEIQEESLMQSLSEESNLMSYYKTKDKSSIISQLSNISAVSTNNSNEPSLIDGQLYQEDQTDLESSMGEQSTLINQNDQGIVGPSRVLTQDEERQRKSICEIRMQVFMFVMILLGDTKNCGIPLKTWLMVSFLIQLLQRVSQLGIEYIDNHHSSQRWILHRASVKAISLVIIEAINCVWLIYGNILYYSSDNNCNTDSPLLIYLMFGTLLLGYVHFILYALVLLILFALMIFKRRQQGQKQQGAIQILKNLTRTKFSSMFTNNEECVICWGTFEKDSDIVKLTCNDKHYFHSECIENWIKQGNNSCPLCREPINRDVKI